MAQHRSRVILPIRQGTETIGLLDLHSRRPLQHSSNALVGLQALADQLGTALRNVELYGEAVAARADAERANQLKSRLLANISHELRTPLNVIEGYSQAALSTPDLYGPELPAALQKDLRHIYASAQHLERLINDLLDLSRAEVGELDIFPEPMDPREVVVETFETMAGSVRANPAVRWQLQVPESLPTVDADRDRLRQIFLNLLSNASKFTDRGHITFGAQPRANAVHVWIEDTGRGITLELQQRIFETFGTAEQLREAGQGIGLGLRVTDELVKLHQGRIW
ncbi:MAG: ATP-binding protein, partial [Anaerolineae bacterium]